MRDCSRIPAVFEIELLVHCTRPYTDRKVQMQLETDGLDDVLIYKIVDGDDMGGEIKRSHLHLSITVATDSRETREEEGDDGERLARMESARRGI